MKKTLILATLAAFTAVSSYSQGFISYEGFLHNVGNNYTAPGTVTYNTGINVELLFGPSSTATAVSAIANSSSPASFSYTIAAAWAAIQGDGSFSPVYGTNGTPVAVMGTGVTGSFVYNASAAYSALNLVPATTYHFYEVAWNTGGGVYTTLSAAAAAGMYVGWSQAFLYTPGATGVPPPATMNAALVGNFLVGGTVVPEPSTIALAGLGGLSLLLFRRRK